ncbi:MAG: hypothetical protein J5I65_13275 [Aridibacter famidurans]|nr:hypothetical protein [Aridibacter famidurans]
MHLLRQPALTLGLRTRAQVHVYKIVRTTRRNEEEEETGWTGSIGFRSAIRVSG